MYSWFRLALSLLQFQVPLPLSSISSTADVPAKRIAIVGGGTSGIVILKTLLNDLPKDLTRTWEIVLFEQRDDIGGIWSLAAHHIDHAHNHIAHARFDHLIVANGHFHYPYEPRSKGNRCGKLGAGREIHHSVYYREPEVYRGHNVLIVGGSASGRDIAQQVVGFANSTYVSIRNSSSLLLEHFPFPYIPGVERVGTISHFTPHAPVFEDGTSLPHIDTVLLATGYDLRFPFLSSIRNTSVSTPLPDPDDCDGLTNNGRYLRPLFRHVFSLAPTHGPHALAFIGPSRRTHPRRPSLLPPTSALLADLRAQEAALDDPARIGHRIVQPGGGPAYQDALVAILQDRGLHGGAIPPSGTPFTEPWRVFASKENNNLYGAWLKLEMRGEDEVRKWLGTMKRGDEAEWADLMVRVLEKYGDE
ncbi:hypothetical protein EI94DRAFT_1699223 [Lactarius quietus]|nr:hypothetical protein EI94DRAFT_1699223 [Lactarius quietus]